MAPRTEAGSQMMKFPAMDRISSRTRAERRVMTIRTAFAICAMLPFYSAVACTADTDELIEGRSLVYDETFSAGDAITSWSNGSQGNYLEGCAPNSRVRLSIVATGAQVGTVDDIPVFATDNDNVGIQFRYQFNESRGTGGGNYWSSWRDLTTTAQEHDTISFVGMAWDTEYVGLRYQARFVARRAFTGDQRIGRTRVAEVSDLTGGIALNQRVFESFRIDAPRQRSCVFSGEVDGRTIKLPYTHTSMLESEGKEGPSAPFSWNFSCDWGNLGQEEAIGIRYTAGTTLIDATKGLMAVDGTAKGVYLQVRRREGSNMVPIGLAEPGNSRWVKRTGDTGTEYLDVRYVRNADPLVTGTANGSLKIYIEPY